jgi:hypothetical protein
MSRLRQTWFWVVFWGVKLGFAARFVGYGLTRWRRPWFRMAWLVLKM